MQAFTNLPVSFKFPACPPYLALHPLPIPHLLLTFSRSHLSIAALVTSLFVCPDTLSDAVTSTPALH